MKPETHINILYKTRTVLRGSGRYAVREDAPLSKKINMIRHFVISVRFGLVWYPIKPSHFISSDCFYYFQRQTYKIHVQMCKYVRTNLPRKHYKGVAFPSRFSSEHFPSAIHIFLRHSGFVRVCVLYNFKNLFVADENLFDGIARAINYHATEEQCAH